MQKKGGESTLKAMKQWIWIAVALHTLGFSATDDFDDEELLMLPFSELADISPPIKKEESKAKPLNEKKPVVSQEIPEEEILIVPFSELIDSSTTKETAKPQQKKQSEALQEKSVAISSAKEELTATNAKPPEKEQNFFEEPFSPQAPEEQESMHNLPSYKGAFVKMMLTLLGLIVLIGLSVLMLRRVARGRFQHFSQGRSIKIVERVPLSAKSILYVVEVGSKKVLIGESQVNVRAISSLEEIPHFDQE